MSAPQMATRARELATRRDTTRKVLAADLRAAKYLRGQSDKEAVKRPNIATSAQQMGYPSQTQRATLSAMKEPNAENEQVNAARAKLETLHTRRAEIEAQRADAQTALEAAQAAAIDGSATTSQLGKAREKIETLNDLWDAMEKALESAQGECDRVTADARHETALQALHRSCAQHLFVHRESVVAACEKANALWFEADARISEAETERETARNEARRAFDELCPDVLNRSIFQPPTPEKQERARALVATMEAAGIDTSALRGNEEQSHNSWLDGQLKPMPENGLIPALQTVRSAANKVLAA